MATLKMENISKTFGLHKVLQDVSIEVMKGEILGLVGENGAGKSTLLNILFGRGVIQSTGGYHGDILFEGKKVQLKKPKDAIALGIGMVHQEFALLPLMTVAENIHIGREHTYSASERVLGKSLALVNWRKNQEEAKGIMDRLNVHVDVGGKVSELSVSLKQFIELARETCKRDLKLLILDEPTATLGREDAQAFLEIVVRLSEQGTAVILVSHRLEEIEQVCHKVIVLRDGQVAARYQREDFDTRKIAENMIGCSVKKACRKVEISKRHPVMHFKEFSVQMPGEELIRLDLEIYRGEILGLAGLAGHGKLAVGNGLMGLYPYSGTVSIEGEILDLQNTVQVLSKGIYLVPEERREGGLLLEHPIMDNLIFTALQQQNRFLKPFFFNPFRLIDQRQGMEFTLENIKRFDIRCQSPHQMAGTLSGGNQQKLCLARAVAMQPQVLFVSEPTRGVDIGARETILKILLDLNENHGTTVVMASSELDEMRQVCDRIAVIYEGRVAGTFSPQDSDLTYALAFSGKKCEERYYA